MGGLVLGGVVVLALLEHDARAHERQVEDHVDLVEGEPVLNEALVARKEGGGQALVELDELAAAPAAVLLDEMDRAVEVRDGHERLDAVGLAGAEDVLVEGEAGLVGGFLVAVGEDARPGDGHAEGLEAHLGEEGDVLLVVVIEVDAGLGGVVVAVLEVEHLALAGNDGEAVLAVRGHVDVGEAAAVHVVGALALVRGGRAAPEEAVGEALGGVCHDAPIGWL